MKLAQKIAPKTKLNQTLRSWLPILQAGTAELKEVLQDALGDNPFAQVSVPNLPKAYGDVNDNNIYEESLYEKLLSQITPQLFPSEKSRKIANSIVECINDEGYFEWDNEKLSEFTREEVERIRLRFAYLEPTGVGAVDFKESFLFQLYDLDAPQNAELAFAKEIIKDFENLPKYVKKKNYEGAIKLIRKLRNPPAIEYLSDALRVEPDIIVSVKANSISVKINDDFYPVIDIDTEGIDEKSEFVSGKIKEAKDLIDALEMRKNTLYKIGLMIIEYQYDYFFGGDVKPMKLKDIALDLGRNPSTISRAIQNKYLESSRGILPLKSFFATDLGEDVSNAAIKDFIKNLVSAEDHSKPLSDEAILEKIGSEFGVKLVRRTITKYRKVLNIGSSSERKKTYAIKLN